MTAILDLFCGAGGATRGYADAGHRVTGVDSNPGVRAAYLRGSGGSGFRCADALAVLEELASQGCPYGFIHASPPCQGYSTMSACRPGAAAAYPKLITPVRELLDRIGVPYIIENVEGARVEMKSPVTLCCWMFGYETYRHRLFEAGGGLALAAPPSPPPGMAGRVNRKCGWPHPVATARAGHWEPGKFVSVSGHERVTQTRRVMAIGWTSREELAEAIPPYMTRWIAEQL